MTESTVAISPDYSPNIYASTLNGGSHVIYFHGKDPASTQVEVERYVAMLNKAGIAVTDDPQPPILVATSTPADDLDGDGIADIVHGVENELFGTGAHVSDENLILICGAVVDLSVSEDELMAEPEPEDAPEDDMGDELADAVDPEAPAPATDAPASDESAE